MKTYMTNSRSIEHNLQQVRQLVESEKRTQLRLNSNGGNAVLVVCNPEEEGEYIDHAKKIFQSDAYHTIDLNALLISYLDYHHAEVKELFDLLRGSVNKIFNAPEEEEFEDLFSVLMNQIDVAFGKGLIPVLVNSGALYGSGIDNIHIMENPVVMNARLPMIVLYPATHEGETLLFLSKRPASKYRCMIFQ